MAKTQGGGRGGRDSSGRRRHGSVSGAKRTTGEEWGHEAVPGSRSAARGRLTKRTMRAWREEETPLAQPSLNELALWPGEAVTAHAVPCRACGGTWRMDARGAQPSLDALELEFITEHLRTPQRVSGEGSVHGGRGSGGGQGQVLPEPAGRTCYDKNGCPSPSFRENRLASVPIGTRVCPKSINVSQAKTYIATKGSTPPMKYSW